MGVLRISLFGKFRAQCGEQTLAGLNARKAQELLCYLLLYRERPHPREKLSDLLWGDRSADQSKPYLRKALWRLQTALDCQTESSNGSVLLIEPDWVQLDPAADLWLDVALFEQAFTRVQSVPGEALDFSRVQVLRSAVDLYQGDLLEGWYLDWCLYERERLQHMYLAMLDKLMGYCEAHREYEAGLVYGARILRDDRARERTHRRLMRLYYLAGDRTAALRQYERCVAALDEELGVRPTQRTVTLYRQVRADQLDDPPPAPAEVSPASEAMTTPLPEVLGRLEQLRATLADVQHQLEQDIQAIRRDLNGRR